MELTYLTEEEKLQVLVYMSEHRLSDNVLLQDKQIRFIEVFLERFIKECDYSGITSFDVEDDYRVIWINDSPIDNYYENCLTEFTERLDKYIPIVEAIGKKMTTQRYVSDEQSREWPQEEFSILRISMVILWLNSILIKKYRKFLCKFLT